MPGITDVTFPPLNVQDKATASQGRTQESLLSELLAETRAVRIGLEILNNLNQGELLSMAREDS